MASWVELLLNEGRDMLWEAGREGIFDAPPPEGWNLGGGVKPLWTLQALGPQKGHLKEELLQLRPNPPPPGGVPAMVSTRR